MIRKSKFTPEEDENILRLKESGYTYKQISEVLTRHSKEAIMNRYYYIMHTNENPNREVLQPADQAQPQPQPRQSGRKVTLHDFTPREMIKHLYDLGYRLEDGKLILVQKTVIKLGDIINPQS